MVLAWFYDGLAALLKERNQLCGMKYEVACVLCFYLNELSERTDVRRVVSHSFLGVAMTENNLPVVDSGSKTIIMVGEKILTGDRAELSCRR